MFIPDSNSPLPLYTQLYREIRSKILTGKLPPGSKLPSERRLAESLNISRNTVAIAYQQLVAEGYLINRPRSGYFTENLRPEPIRSAGPLPEKQSDSPQSAVPHSKYDFIYGRLNPSELPLTLWQKLTHQCLREFGSQLADYGQFQGEMGLRSEISKFLRDYRDVRCIPEQIVVGPGTQFNLGLVCQLLKKKRVVAMENPGFQWARAIFQNLGLKVIPVELDPNGIDVSKLGHDSPAAVYITPSHQFPTGIIMPATRRLELINWANSRQSYIIEDDYSCHLRYNIKPLPALQSLAPERVIYIGSFSKILFPAIRVSFMVLPVHTLPEFEEYFGSSASPVPFLVQKTLERFMRDGEWESHLRRATRLHKAKHDTLIQAFYREFGSNVLISGQNAGLHILVQAQWRTTEKALIQQAEKVDVRVYAASKYWFNPDVIEKPTIILGYGSLDAGVIPEAVRRLKKAWLDV